MTAELSTEAPAQSRWAIGIALLSLAAGLAMVLVVFPSQRLVDNRFDPYSFGAIGASVARGQGFDVGILMQRKAPLYPLLIAAIYALFGEHGLLVLLVQCLLHVGTCLLVYDLGRRMFNERTGIIAAGVCALHPLMLRYVADLQLETLLTFLFTLTLWLLQRFQEQPSAGRGALAGAVAGLASLTKAVVVLYPALFAAVLVGVALRARRQGARTGPPWAGLFALFLAMGLAIVPWTIRNYRATGHVIPISSGLSDAFLRGYVFSKLDYALLRKPPYTDGENEVNELFRSLARNAGTEWQRDEYETDQVLNRAAKEKLRAEPVQFLRKFAVGLFTFWYEMTGLANSLLVGMLALLSWAFASIGWSRARREGRPAWMLVLPALYLNIFLAALLALGRYSAPVLPGLLVVAAYGVDTLLSRRAAASA
jgi:4-amino-4-deoxy-L-arabinose transferase-like glycosyltransferase